MRPSCSHGGECVAGSVSSAVGSLGLGHTAGRGSRWGQPRFRSRSGAPVASVLGGTSWQHDRSCRRPGQTEVRCIDALINGAVRVRWRGCTFVILDDYNHALFTASCFSFD